MFSEDFATKIINWYKNNKRDLPWRKTINPYYIWLSEIILQQTRVVQGLPYYEKFVKQYPTIKNLADAPEDEVLRLWQGLGYYSRAKNLHATAKIISYDLGGKFPDNYTDLLKLKGIGKYTAAAIASFAFKEKVAVLDGNVYRVLARYFGIDTDIASTEGNKEFFELSQKLIPDTNPDLYNQGIMEFGALQCSPAKPNCMYCPLSESCKAFETGRQNELPVKSQKVKVKKRYFQYFLLYYKDQLVMKKRKEKDIWSGLYDFYMIEGKSFEDIIEKLENDELIASQKNNLTIRNESKDYTHILTHQKLFIRFWHLEINKIERFNIKDMNELSFFNKEEVKQLPKPILVANYLNENFL